MTRTNISRIAFLATLLSILLASVIGTSALKIMVEGVIKGRSGDKMILQTSDSPNLVVMLTDNTQVSQVEGLPTAARVAKQGYRWSLGFGKNPTRIAAR